MHTEWIQKFREEGFEYHYIGGAGIVVKPYTFSAGAVIVAAEHNSNFDTLYNLVNGNINTANISPTAAIALSQISFTTALAMSGAIINFAKGADVASTAGTITLGNDGNFFDITGTAAITSITAKQAGTLVMLQFDSTASLVDGSNLKLAGNFTGATESTITLVCDGTNWFELARTPGSFVPSPTNALSKSTIQTVITKSSAVATMAGTAVDDDSIPTLTECPVVTALDTAITASSSSNTLIITVLLNVDTSTSNTAIFGLFLDSGTDAIDACRLQTESANRPTTIELRFSVAPADTSAHTYKIGGGMTTSGTITINGAGGSRKLGGVLYSSMMIQEIKA